MSKKNNFIKTSGEHTATLLRQSGLTELPKEAQMWVFVNDKNKIVMEQMKDAHTTNILRF